MSLKKIFLSCCLFTFASCYNKGESEQFKTYILKNKGVSDLSQVKMLHYDFGGLSTETIGKNAFPWKYTLAAIMLRESERNGTSISLKNAYKKLQTFGFIIPKKIANWKKEVPLPEIDSPVGIIRGYVKLLDKSTEIEVAAIGCTACHGGVAYDFQGKPTQNLWMGSPNTSLNIGGYTREVYDSLKFAVKNRKKFFKTIKLLYPKISRFEYKTLVSLVHFKTKKTLKEIEKTYDSASPFHNGSPGITNGVASLKNLLGLVSQEHFNKKEAGFTSIPDLGDRGLRSSLLYDGVYSHKNNKRPFVEKRIEDIDQTQLDEIAEIVSFFIVPTMSVDPSRVEDIFPDVKEVVTGFLGGYRPQPFPGAIDFGKASLGEGVYRNKCMSCHGEYTSLHESQKIKLIRFPNKLVPVEEIKTDPIRAMIGGEDFIEAIRETAMNNFLNAKATKGYVGSILTGLWATAPYLHNGSVPTLWQLMNPELRPAQFYVGGHQLDFIDIGISGVLKKGVMVYKEGHVPWSRPEIYNTSELGRSNRGHEEEFKSLSQLEKRNLLEYLKLL